MFDVVGLLHAFSATQLTLTLVEQILYSTAAQ